MLSVFLFISALLATAPDDSLIAEYLRDARSRDPAVRSLAYSGLRRAGPEGRKILERLLRDAEKKAAKDIEGISSGSSFKKFRASHAKEIEQARSEALTVIRDRKLYPDDAHGEIGQPTVDKHVGRLRTLWEHPSESFLAKVPEAREAITELEDVLRQLALADLLPNEYSDVDQIERELDEALNGLELMNRAKDVADIEALREYNLTAPSSATAEERRFVRILNDYRLMLGLEPFEIDDRLVVACRKHSQEMLEMDYFAHQSPVEENRTPGMRANREGFSGSPLENCAIAEDAQGAFNGWYRSSGHHRGLIATGPKQLGIGQSIGKNGPGRQWTMLAGSANSLRKKGRAAKSEPRLVFHARYAQLKEGDVKGRYDLARYCLKRELTDEAAKMLHEVVALQPDHKQAHKLLGHVKSDGVWLTPSELLARQVAAGGDGAMAAIDDFLGSEEPALRLAAVQAAGGLGTDGVPSLLRALKDDASEVRQGACQQLGMLAKSAPSAVSGAPAAVKPLLEDKSFYVAHASAATLYLLGDRSGIPTLFSGLRSKDLNRRIDSHKQALMVFERDFGYQWDLPELEREQVVNKWEKWVRDGARTEGE